MDNRMWTFATLAALMIGTISPDINLRGSTGSLEQKVENTTPSILPSEEYEIKNKDTAKVVDNLVQLTIQKDSGQNHTIGTGFFIDPETIITAGHVVKSRTRTHTDSLIVEYKGSKIKVQGKISYYRGDIAEIKLDKPIEDVNSLPIYSAPKFEPKGQHLQIVGFQNREFDNESGKAYSSKKVTCWDILGIECEGRGYDNPECPQIIVTDINARAGNSGAPVIDKSNGKIAGIIISRELEKSRNSYEGNYITTNVSFIGNYSQRNPLLRFSVGDRSQ
mgnify:FL=1